MIHQECFGFTRDGRQVDAYTLTNSIGAGVRVLTLGGIIQSLWVPDRKGVLGDVVLGFETVAQYEESQYFGAVVGPCANRIPDGRVTIAGKPYQLFCNDPNGHNHLHGGLYGFSKRLWKADVRQDRLVLSYFRTDGEEGYPGNLYVQVSYEFTEDCALELRYTGVTDAPTILSMTNHAFFNLAGHDSGSILDHRLRIGAASFTENDEANVATGAVLAVEGTPMDFRREKRIGQDLGTAYLHTCRAGGYDHNYVLEEHLFRTPVAELYDPGSGRHMEVLTTKPDLQLYTGNLLRGNLVGKGGTPYQKYSGLCLETQYAPNAVNNPHFPSILLCPGERYEHHTVYRFSAYPRA